MVMFWPIQQELDCISDDGRILGKIRLDAAQNKHVFTPADNTLVLTPAEETDIAKRLSGLDRGEYEIPMQDDD